LASSEDKGVAGRGGGRGDLKSTIYGWEGRSFEGRAMHLKKKKGE